MALLNNPTVRDAAKAAKVSESTFWRYLREPAFIARYRAARRDSVEHAISQLQTDAAHAARGLREIGDDTTAPASARVTAYRAIIEQAIKGVELNDLMERIERLEEALPKQ